MENNQNNQNPNPTPDRPKRMQLGPRDILIVALIILVLTRINWMNMNSFHVLILFMLFLMLMLRWGNMRKEAVRKQAMERYKAQFEAEAAAKKAAEQPTLIEGEVSETVTAKEMTVDGEAIPTEEAADAAPIVSEETEEKPAE